MIVFALYIFNYALQNKIEFKRFSFTGYVRIVLALISFWFMATNYVVAGWCYLISVGLDAIDGHAARHFNQS